MTNFYTKAGVDIKKAEVSLASVNKLIKSTQTKSVITPENGFAAIYEIGRNQVLGAATDGVGTKLDIAITMKSHRTIGIDLVAMVVNDLAVYGIEPLFFLDYLASSKIQPEVFSKIMKGIVEGCKQADCALVGGETAEMPGFYPEDKYDLAGFAVGICSKDELITGKNISPGDIVIGFASSGLHSNGFSLIRKIISDKGLNLSSDFEGQTLGRTLLTPTIIYSPLVRELKRKVGLKGLAHITGGGFSNISRILPAGAKAIINKNSWQRPAIFHYIQEEGAIDEKEMFDVFNMGIGMAAVVDESQVEAAIKVAAKRKVATFKIGHIEKGNKEVVIE